PPALLAGIHPARRHGPARLRHRRPGDPAGTPLRNVRPERLGGDHRAWRTLSDLGARRLPCRPRRPRSRRPQGPGHKPRRATSRSPGSRRMSDVAHRSVMLDEVVAALQPGPGKLIVDATFGAGGYSSAFLGAGARVVAFDRDPAALG